LSEQVELSKRQYLYLIERNREDIRFLSRKHIVEWPDDGRSEREKGRAIIRLKQNEATLLSRIDSLEQLKSLDKSLN
jgi:hypothetical protein